MDSRVSLAFSTDRNGPLKDTSLSRYGRDMSSSKKGAALATSMPLLNSRVMNQTCRVQGALRVTGMMGLPVGIRVQGDKPDLQGAGRP